MLLRGTAEKAKTAADTTHSLEEMTKAFLFSAKNQVTIWGPNGEINDYSAREWNGVVGDYYYGRWQPHLTVYGAGPRAGAGLRRVPQRLDCVRAEVGRERWGGEEGSWVGRDVRGAPREP